MLLGWVWLVVNCTSCWTVVDPIRNTSFRRIKNNKRKQLKYPYATTFTRLKLPSSSLFTRKMSTRKSRRFHSRRKGLVVRCGIAVPLQLRMLTGQAYQQLKVALTFKDGKEFTFDTPLIQPIRPEESKFTIYGTKVEVVLRKANGISWPTIEPTDKPITSWTTFGEFEKKERPGLSAVGSAERFRLLAQVCREGLAQLDPKKWCLGRTRR